MEEEIKGDELLEKFETKTKNIKKDLYTCLDKTGQSFRRGHRTVSKK